jgi:TonB family protein
VTRLWHSDHMPSRRTALLLAAIAAVTVLARPAVTSAQAPKPLPAAPAAPAPAARLIPIWLAHPAYPQIARSARVQGVVIVEIEVRPDGRVASAKVTRSIPLLDHAALEGANESYFICDGCGPGNLRYTLVFDFQFDDAPPLASEITPARSHIIVAAASPVIDVRMARR